MTIVWSLVGTVVVLMALTTFIIMAIMLSHRHQNARRRRRDIELQIRDDLFRNPTDDTEDDTSPGHQST